MPSVKRKTPYGVAYVRTVVFTNRMDALRRAGDTARKVRAAVAHIPVADLAHAADADEDALRARLEGHDDLNVADLIGFGGFLRVDPITFLKGEHA